MLVAKRWLRRFRTMAGSLSRRSRLSIAVLAGLIVVGGLWMLCSDSRPQPVSVLNEPLGEDQLTAALAALEQKGISVQVAGGRLMTPPDQAAKARSILADEGLLGRNLSSVLEDLSRQNDVWATSDQNDKRWHAAKMTVLSRLIEMFPPVRSAVVIYEPLKEKRLGSAGVEPTASVKVALRPGSAMDRKLVVAISDLVAGSVSGMNRRNVRIVDNSGQSYQAADEAGNGIEDHVERLRAAEVYHRERIQAALHYIHNVIVAVRVEGEGENARCAAASICVPRSYLQSISRGIPAIATAPAEQAEQLQKIQQSVMRLIGSSDSQSVSVDWYYDSPAEAMAGIDGAGDTVPADDGWLGRYWHISLGTTIGLMAICSGGLLLRRRRLRSSDLESDGDSDASARPARPAGTAFGFLQDVSQQDLLDSLRDEHPQTIALVLAHLQPARSAGVLDGLDASKQVEVARRIAAMESIDPEVVAEVEASVAERLGALGQRERTPGLSKVAQILHHAGPSTEQHVLAGLGQQEPALVESIRQRMFRFEDIMHIPAQRLRPILERFDAEELAIALRTANQQMHKRVLGCLSSAAAAALKEEIDRMGPVRLSDVETAQQHVAEAVRRLWDGQYVSQRSSVDSEFVA